MRLRNTFSAFVVIFLLDLMWPTSCDASIAAQVSPSRNSGVAPLAVFFDATGTTSTATTRPFHELDYVWDFGDSGAGIWSISKKSKNDATGPIAAHVYESAGTFIWTLDIKDSSGATAHTEGTVTVTAADSQFTGALTYCFSTGTDFTGAPSSTPAQNKITTSSWSTVMASVVPGRRILLRRGDSWTASTTKFLPSTGPGIIGAFGSGSSKPIINKSNAGCVFKFAAGASDWRLMDLNLRGAGITDDTGAIEGGGYSPQSRTLALRVDISSFRSGYFVGWDNPGHSENFVVEGTYSNIGDGATAYGSYFCGIKCAILGLSITALNGDGGHSIRLWHGRKVVISHCSILDPPDSRHAIKFQNEHDIANLPIAEFNLISDNTLRGGAWTLAYGPQNVDPPAEVLRNCVIERNTLIATPATSTGVEISATHVTVRNNVFVFTGSSVYVSGCISAGRRGPEPVPDHIDVYNNTMYKADNGKEFTGVYIAAEDTNSFVRNNVAALTAFTGYQKDIVINNSGSTQVSNNILRTNANDFVNAAGWNFSLASGSSLRDSGYAVSTVFEDYLDSQRPQGSAWDIGACEYGSGPPVDTTPPSVSITSPAGGSTLSGVVSITASATDNVGVAAVQFKINGVNLGSEDTASPFSIPWDTTKITDGTYSLTAVVRDAVGNTNTSSVVTVTVTNNVVDTVPPAPPTGLRVQ